MFVACEVIWWRQIQFCMAAQLLKESWFANNTYKQMSTASTMQSPSAHARQHWSNFSNCNSKTMCTYFGNKCPASRGLLLKQLHSWLQLQLGLALRKGAAQW